MTNIRTGFFLVLLVLVTFAFLGLLNDFLMACFWAIVLGMLFSGLYKRLVSRLNGRRNLASAITIVVVILIVIIPLSLLTMAIVDQSLRLVQVGTERGYSVIQMRDFFEEQLPHVARFLENFGVTLDQLESRFNEILATGSQWIATQAFLLTQNAASFIIQFTLMLYLLFFTLRDGRSMVRTIVHTVPIQDDLEWMLLERFRKVTMATLKGSVVIAVLQGFIGGVLFWAVGIQAAVLWGVVMAVLSLLPVGGSGLIWAPAAIFLAASGAWVKAIIIVVVGALIIGLVDNLLRPILVSKDTQLPDYIILLSTLGGITLFGISGFVLGPVIAALFISTWEVAGKMFGGHT